ncbi:aminoglycoside phosphotransferase family protein [Peredibacter starrii]|uniref:Phosphotransferase n=1 Tax=Peredibacter starrii TaxID=28202 RepID=A0AAX4HPT4_9BACT|nr:phosphotransferase [Peredibacter starrii]WPU65331.1 phosphotransferase [Peredibacter starrii]
MKPEQAERFFIEELFNKTQDKDILKNEKLEEIDKLTGDASTRRYYRIFTDKKSYVVCLDNPFEGEMEKHPFLSVQQFLGTNKVRVPAILDHNLSRGYSLQEDLGNVTLLTHLSDMTSTEKEYTVYKTIVDQLLELHRIPAGAVKNPNLFQLKFDYQKYMDETRFTFKYFLNFFNKIEDENLIQDLEKLFDPIMKRLADQKMVITHRDFHSRNIMVKDNNYIFIDFQDARWGIPQYDLVSLLEDCYYDLKQSNRESLKRYYYDNLDPAIHGQKTYEQFLELYDDMTIQRVFKAVGSFCYIYNWRKDDRYLKYIGFAMEKIRRVMMDNPRYADLKQKLYQHYYAN